MSNQIRKLRIKIEDAHQHLAEVNKTIQELHRILLDIEVNKYGLD